MRSPNRPLGDGASTRFLYEGTAWARLTRGVISGFGSCLLGGIPPPIPFPGPITALELTELELLASHAF
jgi:hypothetical protein